MSFRRSDKWALGLLALALLLFIAVQVVPFSYQHVYGRGQDSNFQGFKGYEIWSEIIDELADFGSLDMGSSVISFALVLGTVMVISGPFLVRVIASSRALWWFYAVSSGMVFVGLSVVLMWMLIVDPPDPAYWRMGPGFACLMAFPPIHFVGVLWIRRDAPVGGLAPEGDAS